MRRNLLRISVSSVTLLTVLVLAATTLLSVGRADPQPEQASDPPPGAPAPSNDVDGTSTATSTTTSVVPTTTTRPTTTTTTIPPTSGPDPGAGDRATSALRPGDTGPHVLAVQQRLRHLGYWLGTPDASYGQLTQQAVLAFQKVEGLERDGIAGAATLAALDEAGRPTGRSSGGDLVEIDKGRQVLFVIRDGGVKWVMNVSTGTERAYQVGGRTELADTPTGRWTVDWAVDGIDWGDLGGLYRPRYFHPDGIAVHGYNDVPAYPASHGCVRVSDAAMDWIWATNVLPLGSTVWIY